MGDLIFVVIDIDFGLKFNCCIFIIYISISYLMFQLINKLVFINKMYNYYLLYYVNNIKYIMCYILYTNKLWIYFSYHYSITLIPFSIFSLPISLDLFNLPVISYYISKYFIFSIFIIEIHVTDDLLLILYLFYVYYLIQVNL